MSTLVPLLAAGLRNKRDVTEAKHESPQELLPLDFRL